MKKNVFYVIFISIAIFVLHSWLTSFILFNRAEYFVRDFFFDRREVKLGQFMGEGELNPFTHKDTIIVKIDDTSLRNIGKWPWYRDVYAQYINAVNKFGPKQMQLDITFVLPEGVPRTVVSELQSEPQLLERVSSIFSKSDDKFAEALKKYNNIYTDLFLVSQARPEIKEQVKETEKIIQKYSQKAPQETNPMFRSLEPVFDKFATNSMLSTVNSLPDQDLILRRFPLVHVYQNSEGQNFYLYSSVLNMLLTHYRIPRDAVVVKDEEIILRGAHIPIDEKPKKLSLDAIKEKIKNITEPQQYNKNLYNYLLYETLVEQIDEDGAPVYPIHLVEEDGNYRLIDGKEIYDAALAAKSKKVQCIFYNKQDVVIKTPIVEDTNLNEIKHQVPINYPGRLRIDNFNEQTNIVETYHTIPTKSFIDGYNIGVVPDFPGKGEKISQETTDWYRDLCEKKRQAVEIDFANAYPEGGEEEFQTYLFEENQLEGFFYLYARFFEKMAEQFPGKKFSFRQYTRYYKDWAEQMALPEELIPPLSKRKLVEAIYNVYAEGVYNYYGKYLFVGAYSTGMADDVKTTPFGDMFGIGVMANAFNTIAANNQIINVDQTTQTTIFFIFAFVLAMVYRWSNIRYCLLLFITGLVAVGVMGYLVFYNDNLYLNMIPLFLINTILFSGVISMRLLTEERNRKFLQNTFSQYISPELIDIMYNSKVQPQLGGESGIFTAFFTDIQGFSTFSEKLTATQVVELLNEYLTAMTDILLEEQGTLDKYEGDAIIAFFGAPLKTTEHAFYACRAAIRMQDKLEDLKAKWRQERSSENRNVKSLPDEEWAPGDKWPKIVHDMRMRIGINVGEIVVGNMGSKTRMNYTMMGDPVNLAARLESGAKQYGVYTLVSHFTAEHEFEHGGLQRKVRMDEMIEVRFIDKITVVGKSEPVKVYEVISLKNDLSPREKTLLPLFAEAMKLYQEMKWDEALAKFEEALEYERFPDGKTTPCEVFIERCKIFKETPPVAEGEEWDGVFRLASK